LRVWGLTDKGKIRKENQDAYYAKVLTTGGTTLGVCVVCDGMGGVKGGDVASKLAINAFRKTLEDKLSAGVERSDILRMAVSNATEEVTRYAKAHPNVADMGTTLVAALVNLKGEATIANIGDSRCYLIRKGNEVSAGTIAQITKDHSHVEDMIDAGELKREEARFHPQRNYITRAISLDALTNADYFEITLKEGDLLLLCSDGLSNEADAKELAFELLYGDVETAAKRCVNIALNRGAPDNVTVVILEM